MHSNCVIHYNVVSFTFRCCCSTARETTGTTVPRPQTRCGVPGVICWCSGVQVAITGWLIVPKYRCDGGGEGGGRVTSRLCLPDAEEVVFKKRCYIRPALSDTQDYPVVPVFTSMNQRTTVPSPLCPPHFISAALCISVQCHPNLPIFLPLPCVAIPTSLVLQSPLHQCHSISAAIPTSAVLLSPLQCCRPHSISAAIPTPSVLPSPLHKCCRPHSISAAVPTP